MPQGDTGTMSSYKQQHESAMNTIQVRPPRAGVGEMEAGIAALVKGLDLVCHGYRNLGFDRGIGDDAYIAPHVLDAARAVLALLNIERGRLDGGTVDGMVRALMSEHGFTDEV